MSSLLNIDNFQKTEELWNAVNERFSKGVQQVDVVKDSQIAWVILSKDAAQKAMAHRVAEQWLAQPEILDELQRSLGEEPSSYAIRTC